MNSEQIKAAFVSAGLSVRVRDLGAKFRVCPIGSGAFDANTVREVAARLGLTDSLARSGGVFNGSREFIGYKPNAVKRVEGR